MNSMDNYTCHTCAGGQLLDAEPYLFADQANAELDDMKIRYNDLLLRHDALAEKARHLESALDRALQVCANLTQALERRHETQP